MKRFVRVLAISLIVGIGFIFPLFSSSSAVAASLESRIAQIYIAILGRAPDYYGLVYWTAQVESGNLSVADVAKSFFYQPEIQQMYSQNSSDAFFVTCLYRNMFNREPDPDGLSYWVQELSLQRIRRDEVAMYLIEGAASLDALVLNNRTEVAIYFAYSAAGRNSDSNVLGSQAREVVSMVTDDPQTVVDAKARVDYFANLLEQPPESENGVVVTVGSELQSTTAEVDSSGGTVTLTEGDGRSITVRFQEGTLEQSTEVRISRLSASASFTSSSVNFPGVVLDVNTGSQNGFYIPMEITISFDPNSEFPIPYYVREDGTLEPCQIKDVNMSTGTLTFLSWHSSLFTWVTVAIGALGYEYGLPWVIEKLAQDWKEIRENLGEDDLFQPGRDGFSFPDLWDGNCFGMVMWARWYYENKGTGFFSKYQSEVQGCSGKTGQEIIAERAQLSLSDEYKRWNLYVGDVERTFTLSDRIRALELLLALEITHKPTPVILKSVFSNEGHAVLVYDAEVTNNTINFLVYDPQYIYNHPVDPRRTKGYAIIFNLSDMHFQLYDDTYEVYSPLVLGSFFLRYKESFEQIYNDAEDGFDGFDATITVTSHSSGDHVSDRNIVLEGKVTWDGVHIKPIEILEVHVGENIFTTSVTPTDQSTGSFSLPMTLTPGENRLRFVTKVKNDEGELVEVSNNFQCEDFILYADSESAVILVTLTWDKNDTDVDLYVIDPTGDYSAYYHMVTADGGELDYDDTDGYGPEHWTLRYSDTIRWEQEYRIRVHYYSDHGNGGTYYQVTIKMYEGTACETILHYDGYLSVSDQSNNEPLDEGPDWKDIAVIRLTHCQEQVAALWAPSPAIMTTVTAPVPSSEERRAIKETNHSH